MSPLLHIKGEQNDSYLASVLIARQENGYKKLILLFDETGTRTGLLIAGLLYLLIDAAGILLLFLIGRRFVRHALIPAEESFTRQQEFVAAASHELRSPLAVIRASASAIPGAPEHSGKLIRTILKECQRGSSLIKSLLLLASADSHTLSIQKTCFEIDELLLNLLELYEPLFHSRNGRLLLELPEEPLPCVYADPDLCRQILTILLDNAAAGTAAGKIVLKASNIGNTIFLSVEDHGPGLNSGEKERIFDRFYRAEGSRSDKEHFGLGLSIASDLAKAQGIPLSVSDTEGGGCTFTLQIPTEQL
ncbi:HAMP domain-containing histidine kinase [Mediterraneibacter glycyrrhizinilyticus]|uniref:sensor histidine kinase n=1 Tax=Mediterraneibacter glycyrrhizinilyticus TaxID=342942 RepID=UPI0019613488|nr:HAMP domain-containing histidine kinase [Mediterraneibacter glycyrrhizinilyticus]